jgi:hypothetical protein
VTWVVWGAMYVGLVAGYILLVSWARALRRQQTELHEAVRRVHQQVASPQPPMPGVLWWVQQHADRRPS